MNTDKNILLLAFIGVLSIAAANESDDWQKMKAIVPRGHLCTRAAAAIVIDGKLDDAAWKSAAWSDDFVDIEGSAKPAPRFRTRMKMLWDEQNLYIAAELSEPHVWGTITQKNAVIFYDNDFEVFIDPDGDNHNYHEFEMNVLNTIWELDLPKPYKDGAREVNGTNLDGLKSAVHINGTLNDPRDTDTGWTVELAFPWKSMAKYNPGRATPPREGDYWRMGFSRVEWRHEIVDGKYVKVPKEKSPEDNWVWSPQGIVDMHRPERWGFVQFTSAEPSAAKFTPDPTLPARDSLMEVYHFQKDHFAAHKRYAGSTAELGLKNNGASIQAAENGYEATISLQLPGGGSVKLSTRQDSLIWAKK